MKCQKIFLKVSLKAKNKEIEKKYGMKQIHDHTKDALQCVNLNILKYSFIFYSSLLFC